MSNIGTGKRSRFSDRLRKIRLSRFRVKNIDHILEDGEIAYKNFMKVVAVIPLVVADNILDNKPSSSKKGTILTDVKREDVNLKNEETKEVPSDVNVSEANVVENEIVPAINEQKKTALPVQESAIVEETKKDINNEFVSLGKENVISKVENINNINKETIDNTQDDIKALEKKIINLIKKDLVKMVNELEILESELYILNEVKNDEKTLEECRKNIAEVKKILSKIEKLKHKYDYLKDNYDFEYLLEIDNNELLDNIIKLKNKINKEDIKPMVKDYKLLEVYKHLYTKVEDIHDSTNEILDKKNKKEEELRQHNVDFGKLSEKVFDINSINDSYKFFVSEQNYSLNALDDKISKISSFEQVSYRLKGFNALAFNSLKYMALIMLNPLKGVIPAIATQTIIARDIVKNLRSNLKWEENRRMVYTATDYTSELNRYIDDLDLNGRMIDATLEDLIRLKIECTNKYKQYKVDISGYEDTINRISDLQNKMLGNKIKIEIMKKRALEYKKQNENKLVLVRKLNNEQNRHDEEAKN